MPENRPTRTLTSIPNNAFLLVMQQRLDIRTVTFRFAIGIGWLLASSGATVADAPPLLDSHCGNCHRGNDSQGDFRLQQLGSQPTAETITRWTASLERVRAGEMPPAKDQSLTERDRKQLIQFLTAQIRRYDAGKATARHAPPRRLNNREFENSVRDVLLIEDVGTHQPTDNLIGDSLHEGFDTHGATLGFSKFHLEQYLVALRKIVDSTILTGDRPASQRYDITPTQIYSAHTSQNTKRPERRGKPQGFDFLDPKQLAYFAPFKVVPETGWYKITVRCTGLDRGVYDADKTGIYDDDPIRMDVLMGNRKRTFELPDNDVLEIQLDEWLACGSRLRFQYPTDGLTLRNNGNFKFQNAITGEYLQTHDPQLYAKVVAGIVHKPGRRVLKPSSWHHWVNHWRGPRPRILGATIEGPFYRQWPPARQQQLLGTQPTVANAESLLRPIAERAWRRPVTSQQLEQIVALVQTKQPELGDVGALKEGIVAILASPPFLLLNTEDLSPEQRFASKVSYLLQSTIPDTALQQSIVAGEMDSFAGVHRQLQQRLTQSRCEPLLRAFPYAWLNLNDINFMAPDPDRFQHYHRKRVSEDMIEEVLTFFRHVVQQNRPVTELLSANYSFINADLANVYELPGIPADSKFRRHTFTDGRRGGFLGMGAFLTVTADSLGTSPIHRATYVMENFLGIHPTPPPADVEIKEPDIRSAKTIKEVLAAHQDNQNCAACHQRIDPYGYAFENFDPTGAWRTNYDPPAPRNDADTGNRSRKRDGIAVDASARFPNGTTYQDVVEFRQLMQSQTNQERFVRCFITKLLTYANGQAPTDYTAIQAIVAKSAAHDYRILETIAAVIDSPLFREPTR